MSFKQEFVDEVVELVSGKARETLKLSDKRIKELNVALQAVDTKIENLEDKLFTDVINDETYKRNMVKFKGEQAKLNEEIESISNFDDNIQQDLLVLPYMLNLKQVYHDAPIGQKHAIVRAVFKDDFTYKNGLFRTPYINKGLDCNLLLLK